MTTSNSIKLQSSPALTPHPSTFSINEPKPEPKPEAKTSQQINIDSKRSVNNTHVVQSTNNISQQDIDAIQNTVKLCLKDLQDNTATSLEAATKSSQKTAAFNELSNFINILRGEPSVADLQNAAVIFDTLARQPEIPKETQTHCLETKEALNALVNTLNHVRTQPQDPKNQQKIESAFSNLKHTIETALKTPTNKSAWDMDNILSHVFNGVLLLGAAVVCASMIVLPVAIQIIGLVIILVGVLAGVAAFGSISSIAMEHGRPSHF